MIKAYQSLKGVDRLVRFCLPQQFVEFVIGLLD